VEWSDWEGNAEQGTVLELGVAREARPHMCFASPAIRREVTRIVASVAGPALTSELATLKSRGQGVPVCGILVGSEAKIDDYSPGAEEVDPAQQKLMQQTGPESGVRLLCPDGARLQRK